MQELKVLSAITRGALTLMSVAVLAACGGGGGKSFETDPDAPSGVTFSVSASSGGSSSVNVGSTISISAAATSKTELNSMGWKVASLSGASAENSAAPSVVDGACESGTLENRASDGWRAGCATHLYVPKDAAAGQWRISATATTVTGEKKSASFVVTVVPEGTPLPDAAEVSVVTPAEVAILPPLRKVTIGGVALQLQGGVTPEDTQISWTQKAGPAIPAGSGAGGSFVTVGLAGSDTLTPSFIAATEGEYIFEVSATATVSGTTLSDKGTVVVFIKAPDKLALTVNSATVGFVNFPVFLSASAAMASGFNYPISLKWTQVSGTAVVLSNATTANPSFTPRTTGTYVFQVTATYTDIDGVVHTASDQTTVTVAN